MKNKILIAVILLLCAGLALSVVLAGRTVENNTPTVEEEINDETIPAGKTLEDGLFVLCESGYEKTDNGYKINKFGKNVSSERKVSAEGNKLSVELRYAYNNDRNSEMKQFYREQDEAVYIMVSSFLTRVATAAEVDNGTMHYVIYVADEMVREGDMDLAAARDYQQLAY